MCELLGISGSRPVNHARTLAEFRLRGGATADNRDGWGIAYLDHGGFRLHKEATVGAHSELFAQLCGVVRSDLVIAHVRKAKWPLINSLVNTHPFKRSCCGSEWVFAHNGLVPDVIGSESDSVTAFCSPAGDTDSEHAFCHLLHHIARGFRAATLPGTETWFRTLTAASEHIATLGQFNFLMSNGEYLIAYGHDHLHHFERRGGRESSAGAVDVALIATVPLETVGGWSPFRAGELRIYHRGRLIADLDSRPAAERPAAAIA